MVVAFESCGGGSSTGATTSPQASTTKQAAAAGPQPGPRRAKGSSAAPPQPQPQVSSDPPPEQLVVRELKKGTGPALKNGDEFSARYVSFDYGSSEVSENHWANDSIFSWTFGPDKVVKAWAKGLPGMRAGSRRELIAPSRLAYGSGPMVWVVELLSVGK